MMRDYLEGFGGEILRSFYFLDFRHALPCRRSLFLPRLLGAQLCTPFSIPPLNSFFFFLDPFRSQIHLTCTGTLIHCLPPFSHCQIPLH